MRLKLIADPNGELGQAIERAPFSDGLKERLWQELIGPPQPPDPGAVGAFEVDLGATPTAHQGAESGEWTFPLGLSRGGKLLAAALRALSDDRAVSKDRQP